MSDQSTSVLYIHALTSLHPGSGTSLGVVDLPVQRERHTKWPTIPGSAVKGVMRDACRRKAGGNGGGEVDMAFGPEVKGGDEPKHAGALAFTDARILAFPVRSLRGVFAWVTCPAVLERYSRDRALAGKPAAGGGITVTATEAMAGKALTVGDKGGELVLEEFGFQVKGESSPVADVLAEAVADEATRARFRTHLAVIADDHFTHFAEHATEVVARVRLNYNTKTVAGTALFYQEFLPAETIFYSLVMASASRNGNQMTAGAVLQYLRNAKPEYLQVGGDETTGKGLCAVRLS